MKALALTRVSAALSVLAVLTETLVRRYLVNWDTPSPHSLPSVVLVLSILINTVCWVALTLGLMRRSAGNVQSPYERFGLWAWCVADGFVIVRFYFLFLKFFRP
jgi:hypothetical protein